MAYNIFLHVLLMFLYSFQFLFLYSVILTEYNAIEPGVCVCMYVCMYTRVCMCVCVCVCAFILGVLPGLAYENTPTLSGPKTLSGLTLKSR